MLYIKLFLLFIFIPLSLSMTSQEALNMVLLDEVSLESNENGNDIWGYTDHEGREYAIMGTTKATKIYEVSDPTDAKHITTIPGATSIWRDMKTYGEYAYVVADQRRDGLLIIDMSTLPDSVSYRFWKPDLELNGNTYKLERCHNIYIYDGYAYIAGCNVSKGGVLIFKLDENGADPILMGAADRAYSHDAFVIDDRLYTSEIYVGKFGIYDVSDKTDVQYLGGEETRKLFTHNAWTDDENKYLFTTDEKPGGFLESWSIEDLDDIVKLGDFRPLETASTETVIPHNTHYANGYLYTSWYTDGIIITDVNRPDVIVPVASYDTSNHDEGGFYGAWGTYPYFESGNLIVSDIERGLLIFKTTDNTGNPGLQRASYLSGIVQDRLDEQIISGAKVKILVDKLNECYSDAEGKFSTGTLYNGQVLVEVSAEGYPTDTISVDLNSGETTFITVVLGTSDVSGRIINEDGQPISDAKVVLHNEITGAEFHYTTNSQGRYFLESRSGEYKLFIGAWGYKQQQVDLDNTTVYDIVLESGYEDDFFSDLGWQLIESSEAGNWERGVPQSSYFGDELVVTDGDTEDIGNQALLTGVNIGALGEEDVDGGITTISSPRMDWTNMPDAALIELQYHYVNLESDQVTDDNFSIMIDNDNAVIEIFNTETSTNDWKELLLIVNPDQIPFTNNMRLIISAQDVGNSHFIEAQVDQVKISPTQSTDVIEALDELVNIYPVPANTKLYIETESLELSSVVTFKVLDTQGKLLMEGRLSDNFIDIGRLRSGHYHLKLSDMDGKTIIKSFIKI